MGLYTDLAKKSKRRKVSHENKTKKDTSQQGSKETRKRVSKQTITLKSKRVLLQPDLPDNPEFYRKQTFEFSEGELDFLDEAKLTCKRKYRFRVTKNELVRTALEMLSKDFEQNKETSFLVRKFARNQRMKRR